MRSHHPMRTFTLLAALTLTACHTSPAYWSGVAAGATTAYVPPPVPVYTPPPVTRCMWLGQVWTCR